jgi:hypothetical protein
MLRSTGARRRCLYAASLSTIVILELFLAGQVPAYAGDPALGTRPATGPSARVAPHQAAAGGLRLVANEQGYISRSIAGVTSLTTDGGTLTLTKPPGATVRRAYLAIATTGSTDTPLSAPVTIDGGAVPLTNQTPTGIDSFNYFAEVTPLVKPKLDAAVPGAVTFSVAEPEPDLTDGEIAVVIYDDPAVTVNQSVAIMFGALNPAGDGFQVTLGTPIDKADPAARLEMSLGISYSNQSNGSQQYSTVDVNGSRLTTSAGGEDDGSTDAGALLTVGGDGDSPDNPADPFATPSDPRSDDELYDLLPLVSDGDSQVRVTTTNPSLDDNVLLATFTTSPAPVTGGAPLPLYVAVGDSTTTGFSIPTCRVDREASPYGCVGSPPATPYPDRIAAADPRFANEKRVGIWGYTTHEAVVDANRGHNDQGTWTPQLIDAAQAGSLVTVSLGANDMRFSDVQYWLGVCVVKQFTSLKSTCREAARARAESIRPDIQAMMNRLDAAAANGAQVVIALYYNPFNTVKDGGLFGVLPRPCTILWSMSQIITEELNRVLTDEAAAHHFTLAPLAPQFVGHGAGAKDSYVFGSDCDIVGALAAVQFRLGWPPIDKEKSQAEIQKRFDPHPNGKGTAAQAVQILQVVN